MSEAFMSKLITNYTSGLCKRLQPLVILIVVILKNGCCRYSASAARHTMDELWMIYHLCRNSLSVHMHGACHMVFPDVIQRRSPWGIDWRRRWQGTGVDGGRTPIQDPSLGTWLWCRSRHGQRWRSFHNTATNYSPLPNMSSHWWMWRKPPCKRCVCVCVCMRERERDWLDIHFPRWMLCEAGWWSGN